MEASQSRGIESGDLPNLSAVIILQLTGVYLSLIEWIYVILSAFN